VDPADTTNQTRPGASRRWITILTLTVIVILVGSTSIAMGTVVIAPGEVAGAVLRRIGVAIGPEPSAQADAVLWNIRMPRVALGAAVGATLGMAGTSLQGVFRNPLADPQILAVGPGASLGAVVVMLVAGTTPQASLAGATVGAVGAAAIVRRFGDATDPSGARLVLIGVALSAVLSAWVGFVVFAADRAAVPPVDFWLLGSLTGATWRTAAYAAALGLFGALVVSGSARSIDLMSLGESEARHLGVDVELVRRLVLLGTALMVGAAVGAAGVLGFVGLLAPHLMRRFIGPAHRPLLLATALAGAALVIFADLAARTLAAPIEIPVGLVTTVIGGPFFLWLLASGERRMPR
jgi:iron complex transport system permease protein